MVRRLPVGHFDRSTISVVSATRGASDGAAGINRRVPAVAAVEHLDLIADRRVDHRD
jgi:hypothetical protein